MARRGINGIRLAAVCLCLSTGLLGLLRPSCAAEPGAPPVVGGNQPTDESLDWQFSRQKSNLEHMAIMIFEDSNMTRIAPDFTWTRDSQDWPRPRSEWGISKKRWDEYKRMFTNSGVTQGIRRPENSSDVQFIAWERNIILARKSVGFIFCGHAGAEYEHKALPCREEKDSGEKKEGHSELRYRKIAPDWYVYEELN